MSKKTPSTHDAFFKSLSPQKRKVFEQEYKELLLSEMLIAAMQEDNISIRKLAVAAGVSPTIVQGIRSGTRKNVSARSFFKIFKVLGYELVAEKNGSRFLIDFSFSDKR